MRELRLRTLKCGCLTTLFSTGTADGGNAVGVLAVLRVEVPGLVVFTINPPGPPPAGTGGGAAVRPVRNRQAQRPPALQPGRCNKSKNRFYSRRSYQ